jgi:hypothetical protein
MLPESRLILNHWMRQFGPAMALYVLALSFAVWASISRVEEPLRAAFSLAPILPGLALIWLTVRSYRHADEFIRLRILQAAAFAALVATAFSLIYSFLELLGLAHLSAAWISNILWTAFVVQMLKLVVTGR